MLYQRWPIVEVQLADPEIYLLFTYGCVPRERRTNLQDPLRIYVLQ